MKIFYYLTLMRPANIVTAICDIIAGIAIAGFFSSLHIQDFNTIRAILLLVLSTVGLYGGGIVFNDIFDLEEDTINRPERILPRRLIRVEEAIILGSILLVTGVVAASFVSAFSGMLAASIAMLALSYDKVSKHYRVLGPLNMGLCRGGNLLLGMSINDGFVFQHWYIGVIPIIFIAAVTLTAAKETTGDNKKAIAAAMLLDVAVVILFVFMGSYIGLNIWTTVPFLLIWYGMNVFAKYKAYTRNEPAMIQRAVRTGVLSLITLDACYVAGFSGWLYAVLLLFLLPLSILLAKKFAIT